MVVYGMGPIWATTDTINPSPSAPPQLRSALKIKIWNLRFQIQNVKYSIWYTKYEIQSPSHILDPTDDKIIIFHLWTRSQVSWIASWHLFRSSCSLPVTPIRPAICNTRMMIIIVTITMVIIMIMKMEMMKMAMKNIIIWMINDHNDDTKYILPAHRIAWRWLVCSGDLVGGWPTVGPSCHAV